MKYDTTTKDKAILKNIKKTDVILKFLKNRNEFKFTVGDVLIKQTRWGDDEWKTETVSHVNTANKKYLYFYEDEFGVGYIKPILKSGKPGADVTCMTNFNAEYEKFVFDPDYADHLMLAEDGEEFNAKADYERKKEFREKALKENKKISTFLKSGTDVLNFLSTLKVGDTLWFGSYIDDMAESQYEVTSINTGLPKDQWIRKRWEDFEQGNVHTLQYIEATFKVLKSRYQDPGDVTTVDYRFTHHYVTTKSPFPLTENGK